MARAEIAAAVPAGFAGFGRNALTFFEQLAHNQNRDWFEAHRHIYEQDIRAPFAALVDALGFSFGALGVALTGSAKTSLFRINRDVRFSKDKSPYKTNAGAVLSRDGTKQGTGILYIQVGGTDDSFMALGFYGPEPDDLHALRQAIVAFPKEWAKTESALQTARLDLSREHALTRMPKGFEPHAGSTLADVLRLKNLVVRRRIEPEALFIPGLIDEVVDFARAGEDLLRFGRNAIDRGRAERA